MPCMVIAESINILSHFLNTQVPGTKNQLMIFFIIKPHDKINTQSRVYRKVVLVNPN